MSHLAEKSPFLHEFIVLSSTTERLMRVHSGPLSASHLAPGGCQSVGHTANLTFESACNLL